MRPEFRFWLSLTRSGPEAGDLPLRPALQTALRDNKACPHGSWGDRTHLIVVGIVAAVSLAAGIIEHTSLVVGIVGLAFLATATTGSISLVIGLTS